MNEIIQTIAVYALPLIFAITLHEAAHGYVARLFGDLARRGVRAVLSNSDTRDTRALYAEWRTRAVDVARNINSRVEGRGPISEILVVSSPVPASRVRADAAGA